MLRTLTILSSTRISCFALDTRWPYHTTFFNYLNNCLSGSSLDLGSRALGAELGDLGASGSNMGSLGGLSSLGLLLLSLGSSLGVLGSGGLSGVGSGVSLLLDHIERSTDNASGGLDGLSGSLLGNLLSDSLLVLSSVENGPGDSSGVLSLLEERGSLGRVESEDLGVASDKEGTSAGVDLVARKGVDFDFHLG